MKTLFGILLFTVMVSFIFKACKDNSTNSENFNKYVLVEVESAFENDLVQISFDNDMILNSRITTNYSVSLAWGSNLTKISDKNHLLKIILPEYEKEKTYLFIPKYDTTSISVYFYKANGEIEFRQRKGIMLRD